MIANTKQNRGYEPLYFFHPFFIIDAYKSVSLMWADAPVAIEIWDRNKLFLNDQLYLAGFAVISLNRLAEQV